ncbi:crotonase [Candidatus Bathyarchaeota archaeon]|nr:MAG: crotonase [Candidatus Bathyarchaeota archaeon]
MENKVFKNILLEKGEGIGKIILNRPQVLNAISPELLEEFSEAVKLMAEDEDVKVVIVKGAGRAFSSGTDLKAFGQAFKEIDAEKVRRNIRRINDTLLLLENMSKPTIAMIHGVALGAGLELALACDMRIASRNTRLGLPEVSFGLIPDMGGAQRLPRIVGLGKAKELVLTGELIDAEEAERIGLINKVVSEDKLEEETVNLAKKLMENSPIAISMAKSILNRALDIDLTSLIDYSADIQVLCFKSENQLKYIEKFLERRRKEKETQKQV